MAPWPPAQVRLIMYHGPAKLSAYTVGAVAFVSCFSRPNDGGPSSGIYCWETPARPETRGDRKGEGPFLCTLLHVHWRWERMVGRSICMHAQTGDRRWRRWQRGRRKAARARRGATVSVYEVGFFGRPVCLALTAGPLDVSNVSSHFHACRLHISDVRTVSSEFIPLDVSDGNRWHVSCTNERRLPR